MLKSRANIILENREALRVAASAARISTQQGTAMEIFEASLGDERDLKLIGKVLSSGHKSVIEHQVYAIAFNDVSVLVEQFVIEARLASFTVKSRRYVDFASAGFVVPEDLTKEQRALYEATMEARFRDYERLLELGVPKEDARFVLPYCLRSNFYMTLNARELISLIGAMLWGRGKGFPEIEALGLQLKEQFDRLYPGVMDKEAKRFGHYAAPELPDMRVHPTGEDDGKQVSDMAADLFGALGGGDLNELIGGLVSNDDPAAANVGAMLKKEFDLLFPKGQGMNIPGPCEGDAELLSAPADPKALLSAAMAFSGRFPAVDGEVLVDSNIRALMEDERPRELELLNYVFRVKNISLACLTHFTRHRIDSPLIPPVLCALAGNRYVLPESVKANPEAERVYRNAFMEQFHAAHALLEAGISRENLSYLAMSGHELDILLGMNARQLQHFMKLRVCNRAQWEIRGVARRMLDLLRAESPELYLYFGPSCRLAPCPEGKMSCGSPDGIR